MPYIALSGKDDALLTTAYWDFDREYGTIIANESHGRIPAMWIYRDMPSPGAIWYWLNENDCDPDYRKSKLIYAK